MRHKLNWMVLTAALMSCAVVARAGDVFNMPPGQTSLQFVTVGNPGNAADPATGSLYGSVGYVYQMGMYDVTVGQYVRFLNAVATTDTYGLYNSHMAPSAQLPHLPTIGITQRGSSGNYNYAVAGSYSAAANCPIFDVTWGDAARFCNWLQNGQPTSGVENASTTENGAYTLNGAITTAALMAVTRNAGATYFIPSVNEWYKAAYYDPNKPGGAGYWTYPTKSNTLPSNVLSATGTNNANFNANFDIGVYTDPTNYLTPVGTFAASSGPYGTYDMGGDVIQWTEGIADSYSRVLRGGAWGQSSYYLASSSYDSNDPTTTGGYGIGFRVASVAGVPEPGSITLLVAGAIAALIWWRGRK